MKRAHINDIRHINFLTSELQSLYHQSSLKFGITDSISIVLYTIYDTGDECLLSDVYKRSGVSRQTVNSAIRNLEAEQIIFLESYTGKSKIIRLTEKGRELMLNTAARLYEAEAAAFDSWTDEEVDTYLRLMEKYTECFRQQIEKL